MPIPSPDMAHLVQSPPPGRGGQAMQVRTLLRLQQAIGNREVVRLLALAPTPEPSTAVAARPRTDVVPVVEATVAPARSWRERLSGTWTRLAGRRRAQAIAEPPPAAGDRP